MALLAAIVVAILAAGAFAYRAGRVFWMQYRDFYPARDVPALPSEPTLGATLRPIAFALGDGTRIAGWTLPSSNGVLVVFVHGSPGDRRGFVDLAMSLYRAGYGALLLDMPGHGESTGRANWGPATLEAVARSVDVGLQQPGVHALALLGHSMGSYIVAEVASLDPRVGALVLWAPFTELAEQLRFQYRTRVPLVSEFSVLAARAAGVPVDEMRTLESLRASPGRPLLIVAGERDGAIPVSMPQALFDAAQGPKLLWMVKGAGHSDARQIAGPAVFDGRIRAFLDEALLGRRDVKEAR